jgi:hypothetical protein
MKKRTLLMLAVAATTVIASCKKDEDDPKTPPATPNEEEVITTCILQFTDPSGVQPAVSATFRDPDGDGGNLPTQFDTIRLHPATNYETSIILLNETVTPADSISNEVLEEGNEHLFCFDVLDANVTITRTDSDGVFEIGLESLWVTGAAGNGQVTVTLKHQPNGIKDGTCDPGDTDIEIAFPVIIM